MTRPSRIRLLATAVLLCAVGLPGVARASEPWTSDDTRLALAGEPAVLDCIVRLESQYDPAAVGSHGELGVAQLLPTANGGGQMQEFLEGDWTTLQPAYRSPLDPFLSVAYLRYWGETHGWTFWPWSTWRYC